MSEQNCLEPVPYETRNLGVPSFALTDDCLKSFDEKILAGEIEKLTRLNGRLFIQTRLNKGQLTFTGALQRMGFFFAEATLVPFTHFQKNKVLQEFKKNPALFLPSLYAFDRLKLNRVDRSDEISMKIIRSIARESFTDDRFHLDPNCPKETADERFVYWINDLAGDPLAVFYILFYEGNPLGFMARKMENMILTGFSKEHQTAGLGDFLWLSTLLDMMGEGLLKAHTLISVNNARVLNLYVRLGFTFNDPGVTLHYWKVRKV